MKFKVGDKVKCMDTQHTALDYGKVYEISNAFSGDYDDYVNLISESASGWSTSRFELVKEEIIMHKFKVGDVVKITGVLNGDNWQWNHTCEFENNWVGSMDDTVGETGRITKIDKFGIELDTQGYFRYPPQSLELYTEKRKIQKDKKYWTVDGHYTVRIVCTDVKNEKSVLALYTASDEEWLLNINKHGQDNYGNQIIEEVPKIDWSTVALDTPIWVKQYQGWSKQHFAKFNHELNAVCYWDERRTSHTTEHDFDYSSVRSDYAVLTNPNA